MTASKIAAALFEGQETAKQFIQRIRGWQGVVATNGFTKVRMKDRTNARMYQKSYYTADACVVLTLDAPVNRYAPVYFTVFIKQQPGEKELFLRDYRVLPEDISRVINVFEVLMTSDNKAADLIKMIQFLMGNNSVKQK